MYNLGHCSQGYNLITEYGESAAGSHTALVEAWDYEVEVPPCERGAKDNPLPASPIFCENGGGVPTGTVGVGEV